MSGALSLKAGCDGTPLKVLTPWQPVQVASSRTLSRRTAAPAAEFAAMAPQLTDYEMETIARACRALAHVERQSAEKISDTALRAPVQQRAQCAAALAERFESGEEAAVARLAFSVTTDDNMRQ
jgi:hypothetical protein